VAFYRIVPDEPDLVTRALAEILASAEVEAVILNGGTGISKRDRTHEAVTGALDRVLDGFGEIFRALSYAEIGPAAMLSRAVGGIAKGRAVFSVPGSPGAVRLAMEKLILPEISHVVAEARKG
jgi:molybdenum cofactor biosynthesis protein B